MILTVCGHRPESLGGYTIPNPIYREVVEALDTKIVELKPSLVYTGMSLGVDQWAAEICILNDIPFIACVPFEGFVSKWPPQAQTKFLGLCKAAQKVEIVSPGALYSPNLLQIRNMYMVNRSDEVLAVWNGKPSGTANCVMYAESKKRKIHLLNLSPLLWEDASITELSIQAKRAERKLTTSVKTIQSDFNIATTIATSPDFLWGVGAPKPVVYSKEELTSEIRREDPMAPMRKLELD